MTVLVESIFNNRLGNLPSSLLFSCPNLTIGLTPAGRSGWKSGLTWSGEHWSTEGSHEQEERESRHTELHGVAGR